MDLFSLKRKVLLWNVCTSGADMQSRAFFYGLYILGTYKKEDNNCLD